MPTYDIDIPGKGTFKVESPTELTDQQAYDAVLAQLQQPSERKAEDVGFIEGIGAAGKRGLASLGEIASGLGLAGTAVAGTEEETRRKMQAIKEQQAQPEAVPGTRFADLERIYQEQGLGAALKEVPKYTAEQIVQNIPQMAGPLAAGAAASPFLTPVGGALVGMGVYGVQQFGNFLVRQAAEKEDPKELEVAKAALTAAGTAPLGYLADRFTVGLGSLGKTAGKEIIQELAKRKGIDLAGGVAKQVGKGVTAGIIAEAPTEVLEQAAERYQAGLKLTGDDAYNEYKEALFGAIAAGGGIKGITTGAEVGLGVRKERREGGPELQVPEGFVPGMPPEAPQTTAGAIEQPEYTFAPTMTPEELAARQYEKYTAPAVERAGEAAAVRMGQLGEEELGVTEVTPPPVAPIQQPVAIAPQYTPEEIEQTELAGVQAQPVPQRFSAEEIVAIADPKSSINWFAKNVLNKSREDVQALVESNPKLIEGKGARATILRGLLTPPSVEGTGQALPAIGYSAFTPVVFPDGTIAYTPEQVAAYDEQKFMEQFDVAKQFPQAPRVAPAFSPAEMADVRQAQLAAEETPIEAAKPAPAKPVSTRPVTVEPLIEPTTQAEIDELDAARAAVAHPVVHAITEADVASAIPSGKVSKWMRDNVVGKTQDELRDMIAKNSHLIAGNTVQGQTLRKLTQPPTNIEFPNPVTSTTKAQGRIDQTVDEALKGDDQAKYRLNNLGAEYSPEMKSQVQAVRSQLVPALQKFGLQGVALELVDSIENGRADGVFFRNIMRIALDSENPMATMRHEVIHALKKTGAFTKSEWSILENKAREQWINQYFSPEMQAAYLDQYLKDNNGSQAGFGEYMAEEAIAEAFKHFENTKPPAGRIGNLFRRIKELLNRLRSFSYGLGFNNIEQIFAPEQVFRGIEEGRYRPMYGGADVAPAYQAKPRFAKRYAQEGTKLGTQQRANDEVEHLTDGEYSVTTTPQRGVYGLYNNYTKAEEFTGSIKQVVDRVNTMVAAEPDRFAPFKQYSLRPTDRQYKLQIEREKRKMAKTANLTEAEQNAVLQDAESLGLSEDQVNKIIDTIKSDKRRFPASQGWAGLEVVGIKQKLDEDGNPVPGKEKPKYKETAYAFNRRPGLSKAPSTMDIEWRDKVAKEFTKLIKDIYRREKAGDQAAKTIIGHQNWYKNVAATLRREYGAFGDLLSDLLGATSPNTPVDTNWQFSIDVVRRFVRGEFNKEMAAFSKWIDEGKPISKFPSVDKIRQITGKLYGMNSANAMSALADAWRAIEPGTAPKARNFALNLIGQSNIATIDVWAARMLRRAANNVAKGDYKRIPPPAEKGVTGNWNASGDAITGEFGFGASVMDKVSEDLKKSGINVAPPDLQAIAWFAEKELWTAKNWTTKMGEGGSFEENIDKFPVERYIAGHSVQQGEVPPSIETVKKAQAKVLDTLSNDPSVVVLRVMQTKGLYAGTVENSFDTEFVAEKGQFDPVNVVSDIAQASQAENQYDFFVSKVLGPNEENPNARPGVEVYFRNKMELDNVMPILAKFIEKGQDGFTLAVDPRLNDGTNQYIGVRLQYVPEISMRWDESVRRKLATPEGLARILQGKANVLDDVVLQLSTLSEVAYAARVKYDTVVIGKENYNDYISPRIAASNIASGKAVWFGQPVRQHVEAAAGRYSAARGQVDERSVEYTGDEGGARYSLRPDERGGVSDRELGAQRSGQVRGQVSYGSPTEGSVTVDGVHYSRQPRENLDGRFHGTGLSGAERRRLQFADDPRIKRRINFYVDNGSGILPEVGVGSYPHSVSLNNMYDANERKDLQRLVDPSLKGGDWANAFESEVIKAGYDGYVADFGNQRAAVLLGDHVVPMGESKKYSLRAPTTPEFKRWFGKSVATDSSGKPIPWYHGTKSDITEFVERDGMIFVSPDANFANKYAEPSVYKDRINEFTGREETPSVMPLYVKAENPFDFENENNIRQVFNEIKRTIPSYEHLDDVARGAWWAIESPQVRNAIKSLGFDSLYIRENGVKNLALFNSNQVKSVFNERPTAESKDIRYSLRQAEKLAPIVQRNTNFKRWFGNSKVVTQDGKPRIMYHGTARDITEFKPKQAGAIFVTDDPSFAEDFSELSSDYMVAEYYDSLPEEERRKLVNAAVRSLVKEESITKRAGKELLEKYKTDISGAYRPLRMIIEPMIRDRLVSNANIMPVYVRAENPFDYENPKHLQRVGMQMAFDTHERGGDANPIAWAEWFADKAADGSWEIIERDAVQEAIRNAGFDGFYISEGGRKNLGVYSPNQIKSATGNVGTYGDTGDIRYSFNGKNLKRLTKLADEKTAGQKIKDVIKEAHDNFGDRSFRTAWIDVSDSLGKRLGDLPIFDSDGRLRADYLTHIKFQTINLVKNGLVSGIPVVNSDGSVVVQRDENNLARAQIIADSLDTNSVAIQQGMSGRMLVGEVARILRGKDILEEDAQLRKQGRAELEEAKRMMAEARKLGTEGKQGKASKLYKQAEKLRRKGNEKVNINRELQVTPEHIAFAEHIYNTVPEVREVLDIFKEVNHGLVRLWNQVGLIDDAKMEKYLNQKAYVPLFKSAEDLDEDRVYGFRGGVGAKSTPKERRLEGSEAIRNIWENVSKQYAKMTALAIENQTRGIAASQLVGLGAAFETNPSDTRTNLRYRRDGKEVHIVAENPLDVAAFQSMNYQLNPIMKYLFGGATKALRWGALVNPMFWIRQLIRDPMHATLTTDAIVTPLHSTSEFVQMLFGRDRKAVDTLSARGVLGEFGTTMNIHDFLDSVGKDTGKKTGTIGKAIHKVMQIHEAADAATRVAVYKQAYAKAIKDGMSEERATDIAVFKARESINFSVQGNSPTLANLRQMIPFLSATIVSLDTLYRAMKGHNLSAADKAAAKRIFWSRAMMMVALSTAYAMMYAGDDDYEEVPDYEKDNNWLIPIQSSTNPNKKSFVAVPAPFEIGFLFKTLPEVLVRYATGTSTGKEAVASFQAGLIHNMPTGGVPIPQAVRPILENITNHSFFTGNPIEGMSDQRKPVAMRGDRASETAKLLSKYGLDTVGLSPAKIDNLMRGYFAEYGTLFFNLTDAAINGVEGKTPPAKNFEDMPVIRSFMTDPTVQRSISVFYDLENQANQTYNQFNDLKKYGKGEEIHDILTDPDKKAEIAARAPLSKIGEAIGKINQQIKRVQDDERLTADQKRDIINKLKANKADLARKGVGVAEKIGLTH